MSNPILHHILFGIALVLPIAGYFFKKSSRYLYALSFVFLSLTLCIFVNYLSISTIPAVDTSTFKPLPYADRVYLSLMLNSIYSIAIVILNGLFIFRSASIHYRQKPQTQQ